jgi:hypothetical protein
MNDHESVPTTRPIQPVPKSRVASHYGSAAIHVEFIAAVGVHVVPDQGRDRLLIARRELVDPMWPGQGVLQHECVDEDNAGLEQV